VISFIYNLGLTIKPIKGPPLGVSACPHNKKLATLLNNELCVCVCVCSPPLSFSKVLVSSLPHLGCFNSSFLWHRGTEVQNNGGQQCNGGQHFNGGQHLSGSRQQHSIDLQLTIQKTKSGEAYSTDQGVSASTLAIPYSDAFHTHSS
jgi:hypothetical protein